MTPCGLIHNTLGPTRAEGIAQLYLRRDAEAESDFKKAFEP